MYSPEILNLIEKIKNLKKKKYTLKEIKEQMNRNIIAKCKEVLNSFGYVDYSLNKIPRDLISLASLGLSEAEAQNMLKKLEQDDARFEKDLLAGVGYKTDYETENYVLGYIAEDLKQKEKWLSQYFCDLYREFTVAKSDDERKQAQILLDRLYIDAGEITRTQYLVRIQFAMMDGEYEGKSAAQWKEEMMAKIKEFRKKFLGK